MTYDKIILGAGLYGLYAAQKCGAAGQRVLVLERDSAPFMRATYINQARVTATSQAFRPSWVARTLKCASSSWPMNTSRSGRTSGWVRYSRLYAR